MNWGHEIHIYCNSKMALHRHGKQVFPSSIRSCLLTKKPKKAIPGFVFLLFIIWCPHIISGLWVLTHFPLQITSVFNTPSPINKALTIIIIWAPCCTSLHCRVVSCYIICVAITFLVFIVTHIQPHLVVCYPVFTSTGGWAHVLLQKAPVSRNKLIDLHSTVNRLG